MISVGGLRKSERLIKTGQYKKVYRSGRVSRHSDAILYCMPNALLQNRIGFSISAGRVKNAASRNRIKRLFREAYRRSRNGFQTGYDMVFVIKKDPGKKLTYLSVHNCLIRLMSLAGIAR